MKKTSLLALSATTAILLAGVSASAQTYPEELTKKNDLKFEITTKDQDDVKIPEEIDDGGEPIEVPVGPLIPHKGDIAITAVPHLNFGEIKLGGRAETAYQGIFKAKPHKLDGTVDESAAEKEYKPALRVDDVRGTTAGWKLTAQMDKILSGQKEMKGAKLVFPEVSVKSNVVNNNNGVDKTIRAELASNNTPVTVMSAAKGTGASASQATYYFGTKESDDSITRDHSKEINLTIPAGSLIGNYTAEMTYVLTPTVADGAAD